VNTREIIKRFSNQSISISLSPAKRLLFVLNLLFLAFALFFSFPWTKTTQIFILAVQLARDGVEKLVVRGQS
jgi:hypothetical protein